MKKHVIIYLFLLYTSLNLCAQSSVKYEVPKVYSNIHYDADGKLYVDLDSIRVYTVDKTPRYTLKNMTGSPMGTKTGIAFDFNILDLKGTLYYGLIHFQDSKHPLPVYRATANIDSGKVVIDIKNRFSGKYDMTGWQKSGKGTIGYRVIDEKGSMIYDGIISFSGKGPFEIDDTIIEGPFVDLVTHQSAIISYETNNNIITKIEINEKIYSDNTANTHHEIEMTDLQTDTEYTYSVKYGKNVQSYSFKTAPKPGSRRVFNFAYASDSRAGQGGGERNLYGANYYIMKKILALVAQQKSSFLQFTGDLVNGYVTDFNDINLQYANWKRAVEPFAHYIPIYVGIGNHEAIKYWFFDKPNNIWIDIARFPFKTESTETIFAQNFVNPANGPASEDGMYYDPDPNIQDFPSYSENVFYYKYDNVAMIVLNSDYWYSPSSSKLHLVGGCLHGYIMDKQLKWLNETIQTIENDKKTDHIFVTLHTPFFPNGGHVNSDMWYHGNNKKRPFVAGEPLKKGIIERRDELLDILVNKSTKVRAILTGDEHNYNKLEIGPNTNMYPDNWELKKLNLDRTIYQVNNGAAGAPYYAQEQTPWTPFVSGFTTQNAVVFFHIEGKSIVIKVLNPDTLEEVDYFKLN
ncbi:metallophosphoesterase [Calditrichota bacterium]